MLPGVLCPKSPKKHPHLAIPDRSCRRRYLADGGKFDYTNFKENEMSLEGVMFYLTDSSSGGYVLTPKGTTVPRGAPEDDNGD